MHKDSHERLTLLESYSVHYMHMQFKRSFDSRIVVLWTDVNVALYGGLQTVIVVLRRE